MMHKGQFLWQFNLRTKELIRRDDYKKGVKIERLPDCLYVSSINRENAAKKILQLLDEMENKK